MAQVLPLSLDMNRIAVVGDQSISAQARTYAEYRVFAALTRHGQPFRRIRVLLREKNDPGRCDAVTCSVAVALEPSASVRIRATGSHVYAAINRAIDRLGEALGERVEYRRSS
jgi:ribosome-associated translation inhibitor RaiA